MAFNEEEWLSKLDQVKTSQQLRDLVMGIPDDYERFAQEPSLGYRDIALTERHPLNILFFKDGAPVGIPHSIIQEMFGE